MLPDAVLKSLSIVPAQVRRISAVRGGDTSAAYRLETVDRCLFVKTAHARERARFTTEKAALLKLGEGGALRVPTPFAEGAAAGLSFLALEWLDLRSGTPAAAASLGRGLARLHQMTGPAFGWDCDNFIGQSVQPNGWHSQWSDFYVTQRLGFQAQLSRQAAATRALYEPLQKLMVVARDQLDEHQPPMALVHGDLWAGNWGELANGTPVIFDPAAYYGDPETDLAMTQLFGGFDPAFYHAYQQVRALPDDYASRTDLYQLYHVLNHANLFAGHYVDQAMQIIERALQ